MSDKTKLIVNHTTGHLKDCCSLGHGMIFEKQIVCSDYCSSGSTCGNVPVHHSCVNLNDGHPVGLCFKHWSAVCDHMNWDIDLSRCANRICDAKRITMRARHDIVPLNIIGRLGLQPVDEHFSSTRHRQIRLCKKARALAVDRAAADAQKHRENLRIQYTIQSATCEPRFDPGSYEEDSFLEKDSDDY